MVDEFNEERARDFTLDCLRATGQLIKANDALVMQILMGELGAPDEATARSFLVRMYLLLGMVAEKVSKSNDLRDALAKPGGKEMH